MQVPVLRRHVITGLTALVALGLPGVASAHGGGSYSAAVTAAPPAVDGVVNASEWSGATPHSVTFGTFGNATVRFLRTSTDLYVGVVVQDASSGLTPSFDVFFDNDHDGVKELNDDAWLSFSQDFFYNPDGTGGASHYNDTTGGGTVETVAAQSVGGGEAMFELKHPLCSNDVRDICASVGQTLGVDFQYERTSPGGFVNAPGPSTFDPSVNWADLVLAAADTTPPTVTVTAPAAGSTVSGTVAVAADASDDVGVASVKFRYHGGGSFFVELGTDTTAPYTASFDSTQVPNTVPLGATIYAFARDAAGNETGVGNGITVSNPPSVDLTVDSIAFTPGVLPHSYTVTVRNAGNSAASVGSVVVQGYYSADTLIDASDSGACGVTMSGTLNAGTTTQVPVGCSAAPGAAHNYLLVRVDNSNALAESNETNNVGAVALGASSGPTGASISISGGESALVGAASAKISAIGIDAIRGATSGPSATPLGGIPLGGIPLGGIPLGGIPLGGIPLGGIPLGGIGFTATNLDQNGLGGVPLSTIPLKSQTDTWQSRLDANPAFKGTPPQSVTLAQVLGTSVVTSPTPVTLDKLDLAASPLGGIPLGGIALGGVPLGGIPLGGIPLGGIGSSKAQNLADWCAFINQQPGFTCTDPSTLSSQTMIGIALQGVPLGGIPLGGIPLGGIDLSNSPLGGIPLGGIPLGGIDLAGTPLGGIPLGGIPLGGIDLASSPLGGIPLGGIPLGGISAVLSCSTGSFDCSVPSATLADAFAAGAVKPTAKVQDIGYYCRAGTPANSACRAGETPILLKDFVLSGLPPGATLEDLLGTILSKTAYDWETLPLPGFPIQDFSEDGGTNTYTATFTLTGSGTSTSAATVEVDIPDGARYVAGSTEVSPGLSASVPTLLSPQNELSWQVTGVPFNVPQTLTFKVRPGLTLGTEAATAKLAAAPLASVQAAAPATTAIQQFVPDGVPVIAKDTLYFGHTASGQERDLFRLPVPAAGTQVTVRLSHLKLDADLVVYGPVPPPLRTPKPATSVLQAPDVPPDLQQRTQTITPEVLADVPVDPPAGQGVLGISDNRGLADEEVTFIVPEDAAGYVTIQVSSFDGAYSNEPWMLRVEQSPPLAIPAGCETPTPLGGGTTKPMPAAVTGSTLYLFNSKRYGDLYGSAAEDAVWTKLQAMAARTDAAGGTVIPVDAISTVASTLADWQANPCAPGKSNDVVRALGAYLDTVAAPYKYIVLVGDWTVLPPGLVLDNTSFANERLYATTFYGSSQSTQYLSSYALGYLPTDDPYGDTSYSGHGTYVPEVAVGRLVETPAQIEAQLQQYLDRQGAINPTTALVTGYDFISDGAQQISAGLKAKVSAPVELINDIWSRSDLLAALFPASSPPQIASINAHFDHNRALPADENAANRESILFKTSDLQATPGRLVITIGCHSGTPVADSIFGGALAALAPDWSQSFAASGAIGYVANNGFGLGETAGVAYSEKLHALLAQRLNGALTVGQALVFAKQEYMAIPLAGGYDLKVVNGAGLYGLPMYRIGTGALAPPPVPLPLVTDAATGLKAASFSLSPSFTKETRSTGSYYTVAGDASFQNRRPIEPFTKLDVTQPDYVAHGALLTAAASSDIPDFDAAFSRAIEDSAAFSPELVGDATSPTRLQSIATFSTPVGVQQRLVISTGQFLADGTPDPFGIGTQRLFNSLSGVVLYAPSSATDFSVPTFGPVQASATGPATIGFAVDVVDNGGIDAVKRVLALYKDGSGTWQAVDLSRAPGSSRWSGGGPFSGSTAEWFLQAVDAFGNVGVISNKGHIDPVVPSAPTGGISAAVEGPQAAGNEWFTDAATVTISGAPDIVSSVDGAPFAPSSVVNVSGTGLHTVEYQGSNGARGTTIVPIDVTAPTIAIAPGILKVGQTSNFGFFTCADAGSGVASCVATGIDTSTPTLNGATRTVTVTATDRVGRTSSVQGTYQVLAYTFRGFLQPVDNLPVVNLVKSGSTIPVKFSLGGNQGLNVFADGYPKSRKVSCDPADPITSLEATVAAGGSTLSYDSASDQYTYAWKTDKAWIGTCRQVVLRFVDGGPERIANFKFK